MILIISGESIWDVEKSEQTHSINKHVSPYLRPDSPVPVEAADEASSNRLGLHNVCTSSDQHDYIPTYSADSRDL